MSDSLAAYLPGHFLKTESATRFDTIHHSAICECGVKFSWYPREKQHTEHVINILQHNAWAEGQANGWEYGPEATNQNADNPYPVG